MCQLFTMAASHTVCSWPVEFTSTPALLCAGMLMLSSLGDMVFQNLSTSLSYHHTGLENLGRYMCMYIHVYILKLSNQFYSCPDDVTCNIQSASFKSVEKIELVVSYTCTMYNYVYSARINWIYGFRALRKSLSHQAGMIPRLMKRSLKI